MRSKRPEPQAPPGARRTLQHASPSLATLVDRALAGERWAAAVRDQIEPAMALHVAGAVLDCHTLVVLVDSPAWAARLRYLATDLLRRLHDLPDAAVVTAVRVQVAVSAGNPSAPPPRRPALSPGAADYLRHVADSTGDPELRSTFARLSQRVHKKP